MSRRSSVSASAPSLVPRNATSFVSLLAKLLVLRARLSLPSPPRVCARERMREKEREKRFSHERARSSRPLALRSFFHPFFLSPPFSLSFIERLPLGRLRSSCSCLFFFLSRSLPLAFSACYRSRVSPWSLAHFPPLPRRRSFFFLGGSRIPRRPFSFLPSVLLFSRGWLLFHLSSHQREYFFPSATVSLHYTPSSLFSPRPFLSLSIAVFCTLRI